VSRETNGRPSFKALRVLGLDQRIQETHTRMQRVCENHEACQRLAQLEGVGPLTATAFVAAGGEATTFKNGRECAA
jgi:transposase